MKNIVIVGFMGTGKTAVARKLAEATGFTYVSIDGLIEESENRSINDIFREEGEKYFRQVEKKIVRELSSGAGQIIDAGGGAVRDPDNMDNLKSAGIVICLWAEPETIYERTKKHSHRPLLNVEDPLGKIKDLLDKRRPFYGESDFHVDTTDKSLDDVLGEVEAIIKENG